MPFLIFHSGLNQGCVCGSGPQRARGPLLVCEARAGEPLGTNPQAATSHRRRHRLGAASGSPLDFSRSQADSLAHAVTASPRPRNKSSRVNGGPNRPDGRTISFDGRDCVTGVRFNRPPRKTRRALTASMFGVGRQCAGIRPARFLRQDHLGADATTAAATTCSSSGVGQPERPSKLFPTVNDESAKLLRQLR